MSSYSAREAMEQRRRNWRIALSIIIAVTIPFYCAGVFLWGTAPQRTTPTPQATQQQVVGTPTAIVITATPLPGFPSITPLPITLFPTSQQFPTLNIPTPFPSVVVPTRFLSPTPIIVQPTQPPPPTNPPAPTQPPPPTQSAITDTPIPFDSP